MIVVRSLVIMTAWWHQDCSCARCNTMLLMHVTTLADRDAEPQLWDRSQGHVVPGLLKPSPLQQGLLTVAVKQQAPPPLVHAHSIFPTIPKK